MRLEAERICCQLRRKGVYVDASRVERYDGVALSTPDNFYNLRYIVHLDGWQVVAVG